jgi:hypothetical protein
MKIHNMSYVQYYIDLIWISLMSFSPTKERKFECFILEKREYFLEDILAQKTQMNLSSYAFKLCLYEDKFCRWT